MNELQSKSYWNGAWKNYFDHYQQDKRHAYYINAFLNDDEHKILEMASGSFRDFAELNALHKNCYAFDYSEQSVSMAKQYFPELKDKISIQDAFHTDFADNEFDFSFHNGFWSLFFDDGQIIRLALEQLRITKKRIAFTVHNGHNKDFIAYFDKLKQNDILYDVRFFTMDEIKNIVSQLPVKQESLKIYPVGKGKKYHEDELIYQGKYDKETIFQCISGAGLTYLDSSERLLCIAEK